MLPISAALRRAALLLEALGPAARALAPPRLRRRPRPRPEGADRGDRPRLAPAAQAAAPRTAIRSPRSASTPPTILSDLTIGLARPSRRSSTIRPGSA